MRTQVLTVVLSFCLGGAAIAERHNDGATAKAKEFYDRGMTHYNLNEFAPALAAFQDAYRAKHDPAFPFNIAQCYRQRGKPDEAAKFYRN